MTITNAELRALAERATPGPWEVKWDTDEDYGGRPYRYPANIQSVETKSYIFDGYQIGADGPDYNGPNDAAYIAAAHPARIIELLDASDSKDRRIDFLEKFRDAKTLVIAAKDDELAALRAKLEIAMRALTEIYDEGRTELSAHALRVVAHDALAQIKEQP